MESLQVFLNKHYLSGDYSLCLDTLKDYRDAGNPAETFIYDLVELHLLCRIGSVEEAAAVINSRYRLPDLDLDLFGKVIPDFAFTSPIAFFEDIITQLYKLSHPGFTKNVSPDYIDNEALALPSAPSEQPVRQMIHYVFYKDYYLENDIYYNELFPVIFNLSGSDESCDSINEFLGLYILELISRPVRNQGPDCRNYYIMITEAHLIQHYEYKRNHDMIIQIGLDLSKYTLPEEYRGKELFLSARYNLLFAISETNQKQTVDIAMFDFVLSSAVSLFPDILSNYYKTSNLEFNSETDIDQLYIDYIKNVEEGRICPYYPVENLYYYIKGTAGNTSEH